MGRPGKVHGQDVGPNRALTLCGLATSKVDVSEDPTCGLCVNVLASRTVHALEGRSKVKRLHLKGALCSHKRWNTYDTDEPAEVTCEACLTTVHGIARCTHELVPTDDRRPLAICIFCQVVFEREVCPGCDDQGCKLCNDGEKVVATAIETWGPRDLWPSC